MKILCIILLLLHSAKLTAQAALDDDLLQEQQLEDLAESGESESEDDFDAEQVANFTRHPLNINASEASFRDFPFLQPLQVENLLRYRKMFGDFISIYELQAVPGFSIGMIKKILPYIKFDISPLTTARFRERWKGGQKSLLIRPSFAPDNSEGFTENDTTASSGFMGSRLKLYFKYKYQYRDLLQYGFVGDKDAGEPFTFNGKQPGFDFTSFHIFIRKLGVIKSLAIGDYTINLGQGLIHWQSQAFKKTSAVINIKRQANNLRPYSSAGEYNFHRGVAATTVTGKFETTVFASFRNLSAHLNDDPYYGTVISSLQTSGYHRTLTEQEQKNIVRLSTIGGSIKWNFQNNHFAINGVHYHYSLPLLKRDEPYNLFSIKGSEWFNYSVDYSYTFRNYHFFGEEAIDKNGNRAFVNGLMATVDASIDIAILHRSISSQYQSVYGNAFTESTMPSNENGIYFGLSWKLNDFARVDFYSDLFSFPWLRYRTDAPGFGIQYMAQLNYKPNKKAEVYSRVRWRSKPLNLPLMENHFNIPDDRTLANWRTNITFQFTRTLLLRTRMDLSWFNIIGREAAKAGHKNSTGNNQYQQAGFLQYADVVYKPTRRWYSANFRLLIFETEGYDTRLYAYENDVPYNSSTPAFSGRGIRLCFNVGGNLPYRVFKIFSIKTALKIARTIYTDKSSGDPVLSGTGSTHKLDIKVQMLINCQ